MSETQSITPSAADRISKASGYAAIGLGLYGIIPLFIELAQNGVAAYKTCGPVLMPIWTTLVAIFAYLAKSPLQAKK